MCLSLYINYMYLLQQVPGYLQLHQVTVTPGYLQLQQVTCSYTWLLTVTAGYLQLQQVTCSYTWLHTVLRKFMVLNQALSRVGGPLKHVQACFSARKDL